MGRKWVIWVEKSTFFLSTQKMICEVWDAEKLGFTSFKAVFEPLLTVSLGLFSLRKGHLCLGMGLERPKTTALQECLCDSKKVFCKGFGHDNM